MTLLEDQTNEIIGCCCVFTMSWRGMTTTPAFLLELHYRQMSLPLLDGHGQSASLVVVYNAGAHQQLWPFLPGCKHHSKDCLRGTCDVYLTVSRCNQLYITTGYSQPCSPAPTSEQCNTIISFYCHHPTGKYRAVLASQSLDLSNSYLYVLKMVSSEARHVLFKMPRMVSSPFAE